MTLCNKHYIIWLGLMPSKWLVTATIICPTMEYRDKGVEEWRLLFTQWFWRLA
jgi:hypothetical protein